VPKPTTTVETNEVIADPDNDRRHRRGIPTEDKLRILAEANRCTGRGELAAMLRREGVYSSQLSTWRKKFRSTGEAGLARKTAGRKPTRDERDATIEKLEREKAKLEHDLLVARKLVELAGKAHEILGVTLPSLGNDEKL
jgi:transposase-like protein